MTDPITVTVRIPARLQPAHRDELIVTPVRQLLEQISPGTRVAVTETVVNQHGEPLEAVLELEVPLADAERVVTAILDLETGLPKGSLVEINGKGATFGELEGLAVYLNGTDLDDEVYAAADLQALVDDLQAHLDRDGQLWSYWQGPTETALYFYGPDAGMIRGAIDGRVHEQPLMERCRMVQLVPEGGSSAAS